MLEIRRLPAFTRRCCCASTFSSTMHRRPSTCRWSSTWRSVGASLPIVVARPIASYHVARQRALPGKLGGPQYQFHPSSCCSQELIELLRCGGGGGGRQPGWRSCSRRRFETGSKTCNRESLHFARLFVRPATCGCDASERAPAHLGCCCCFEQVRRLAASFSTSATDTTNAPP